VAQNVRRVGQNGVDFFALGGVGLEVRVHVPAELVHHQLAPHVLRRVGDLCYCSQEEEGEAEKEWSNVHSKDQKEWEHKKRRQAARKELTRECISISKR